MAGTIVAILVLGALLAVVAKIGWDAVGVLREERRTHGHVTAYGLLRVGIIALLVLLFLGWLAMGFFFGEDTPPY